MSHMTHDTPANSTPKPVTRRFFLRLAALAGSAVACNLPSRGAERLAANEAQAPDVVVYVTATPEPTSPPTPTLSSALDPTATTPPQPTLAVPVENTSIEQEPAQPQATKTPEPTPTRITEVALELGFVLANDAVDYSPSADGCDRTQISGVLQDHAGNGVPDIFVRIRRDGSNIPIAVSTDRNGNYIADVAEELSDHTYRVQLTDETGARILSDPIIAQAIPDCNRNQMVLNFILRT